MNKIKKNFFSLNSRYLHGFGQKVTIDFHSMFLKEPGKFFRFVVRAQRHPYHVVTRSPWPIFVSICLGLIVIGVAGLIQNVSLSFIYFNLGFYGLFLILGRWFLDIWIESLLGHHTKRVSRMLRFGFYLMIISEIMFFFAFFWSLGHFTLSLNIWTGHVWPYLFYTPRWWGTSLIGTGFLIVSCIWLTEAGVCWKWCYYKIVMYYLFATIWCGLMFLYIQVEEFLFVDVYFNEGLHGSLFYMLTGFHFFHVFLGLIFIITTYTRLLYNWYIPVQEKFILLNITSWYWQFVDYVWIFLYLLFYVVLGKSLFFIICLIKY